MCKTWEMTVPSSVILGRPPRVLCVVLAFKFKEGCGEVRECPGGSGGGERRGFNKNNKVAGRQTVEGKAERT